MNVAVLKATIWITLAAFLAAIPPLLGMGIALTMKEVAWVFAIGGAGLYACAVAQRSFSALDGIVRHRIATRATLGNAIGYVVRFLVAIHIVASILINILPRTLPDQGMSAALCWAVLAGTLALVARLPNLLNWLLETLAQSGR